MSSTKRATSPPRRRRNNAFARCPMVQPRGELAGLLTAAYSKTRLTEMALDAASRGRLDRVLTEQRQSAQLESHGLRPQRKLLLVGPPGTGKSMTALAFAGELSLPLFSIQLHSLITEYLGETAAKLRLIFDAIRENGAWYLFDDLTHSGPTAPRAMRLARFGACLTRSSNSLKTTTPTVLSLPLLTILHYSIEL